MKRIQRVRPATFCSRHFFFLHINVPVHKTAGVCQFLTPKMSHPVLPPYSPYLPPPDYFLFPALKMKLKGLHFADVVEIQVAANDELKKVQNEEFLAAFQKLYGRTKACIYANGAYFE